VPKPNSLLMCALMVAASQYNVAGSGRCTWCGQIPACGPCCDGLNPRAGLFERGAYAFKNLYITLHPHEHVARIIDGSDYFCAVMCFR
jgi:hypothetical protein